ncbi:unnamed protein product [Pleuronectes platessa]|uniref:Uncharacterized protein n=1 Tax=Pleuronectes platessa TaxID=8262 RepID=A0A9N7U7P0_PLEPL|nr:unnamed protein product [Pleuronectes platessa]
MWSSTARLDVSAPRKTQLRITVSLLPSAHRFRWGRILTLADPSSSLLLLPLLPPPSSSSNRTQPHRIHPLGIMNNDDFDVSFGTRWWTHKQTKSVILGILPSTCMGHQNPAIYGPACDHTSFTEDFIHAAVPGSVTLGFRLADFKSYTLPGKLVLHQTGEEIL